MTAPVSDPFAEVQVSGAAPVRTAPASTSVQGADPFSSAVEMDDPFATSADLRGSYTPSPSLEALTGRLAVMIPRSFDPEAPNPLKPGETREVYTVDLYVLTGGPLSYVTKRKGDPEASDSALRADRYETFDAGSATPNSPLVFKGYWVPQGAIVGALKKTHGRGAPYLGVVGMGPTKTQRDKGVTAAQVRAEHSQWIALGKPGEGPKFAWTLDVPTPEQRETAVAWWSAARGTIDPITVMTHSRR